MELTHTHIAGVFEARVTETPETVWGEIDAELGGIHESDHVTEETSQKFASVFQAVNVYAGDVAQIPAIAYERVGNGKERASAHPAHRLMHRQPNAELGPFQFKYLMQARCCLWGNAYAYIERQDGVPVSLWPIEPNKVTPFRAGGELYYSIDDARGVPRSFDPSQIFHLRGPGTKDMVGSSLVELARETLSGGIQADKYANRFLKNNATPPLVLEFPEAVDEATAKNVLKFWSARHAGPANAGRPGFLDRGGKVSTYSMSHVDSQWLEGRKFNKTEVASWFNLPPHKLGDLDNATFSNIEQQSIDYVVFSLMPWLVRWQDECNRKLFQPEEIEQDRYFVEFLTAALVRGDLPTRMEAYSTGIEKGIYTFNEVRSFENLNPVEGGDRRLVPLNMALVDEQGAIVGTSEGEAPPPEDLRTMEPMIRRELRKLCTRLEASANNAAKKPREFLKWLDDGLERDHRKVIAESVAVMEQCTRAETGLTDAVFGEFKARMLTAADGEPGDFESRVAGSAAEFVATLPTKAAEHLMRGEKWNAGTPNSQ